MAGRVYKEVFEIAADRFGFLTAVQAREHGIDPQALIMMAKRGTLRHVSRGVYRLAQFPETELDYYMEAVLWPYPVSGVLSHESALALYDLSDVNPSRVHVTVPAQFRSRRSAPRHLALHANDLSDEEVILYRGLPVTTPERTIIDCHRAAVGPAIVRQAISDAEQKGLIDIKDAAQLRARLV